MPTFRNRTILELARSVKVFLKLDAGVICGEIPEWESPSRESYPLPKNQRQQVEQQGRKIEQLQRWLEGKDRRIAQLEKKSGEPDTGPITTDARPDNVVWIFGTARVGSTWLGAMMGEIEDYGLWREPLVGDLFGGMYYVRSNGRTGRQFVLGGERELWMPAVRAFLLSTTGLKYPQTRDKGYVVAQEPNGSIGAPLLMEALPESRMILLIRDPRDVLASALDAHREGSWYKHGQGVERGEEPESLSERLSRKYLDSIGNAKQAYEAHAGPKVLVRYEDLASDTLKEMRRIYSELGLPVDETELKQAVGKHSWENIPEEKKGEGKFYRKGEVGSWREELTPDQVELVERITGPLLEEFYVR